MIGEAEKLPPEQPRADNGMTKRVGQEFWRGKIMFHDDQAAIRRQFQRVHR